MFEETATTTEATVPATNGRQDGDYGAENIQVLKNAAHVRQNPGMYIGDVGSRGLHHLVYEVVHNSVDEAMAGYCKTIHVVIHHDESISIEDDGRGIPVEMHPTENRPTLELVMTEVGAGGKFRKDTYKVSAGLHGIGIKAVNALSEWTEVKVRRDGNTYQQDYERGKATSGVITLGPGKGTGTNIAFKPDPEIFHETKFDYDTLENRFRELAFLNKGLEIKLTDERTGKHEAFKFEGGIREFVEYINRTDDGIHKVLYFEEEKDNVYVEVAFQYHNGEEERSYTYVNNVHTPSGGTHLSGFRGGLTRTVNHYGNKESLIKENISPIGEDFREGLTAIISVRVPHPQFESQTKIRLNNPEVEGIVGSVINEHLGRFLEENPQPAKKIVQKILLSAEAREAAAKAKKQLKDRKTILGGGGLPGKLMDCTSKDRDECELFLVEGDSAGGSADGGRDRFYQAVLPLRGKILNVEKARIEKMLDNNEICNIISAVGTDIGPDEDVAKRNYDKIILLTDADVDGSHIRTLLLTFFYRQMTRLVGDGHVYLAQPPLYRIVQRKTTRYVQTNEEMYRELIERGLHDTELEIVVPGQEPRKVSGPQLAQLVEALAPLENALQILERRSLSLPALLPFAKGNELPQFRVLVAGEPERWFVKREDVTAFLAERNQARDANAANAAPTPDMQELHEVKAISRGLDKLRNLAQLDADALTPVRSVAGQELPPRFFVSNGDVRRVVATLRDLLPEIRKLGEKGLNITRFKGLGEMNPDELWETTLDPEKRVLLRVRLEDLQTADTMFRTLMGDKVEPRREFIEKHALDVRNLDV